MAQDGGKFVSLTHRLLFTPRKCSWYSFLLEAESTPRAIVRSEGFYVNEISTDTSWDGTSDLPICSTAPLTTVTPRSPTTSPNNFKFTVFFIRFWYALRRLSFKMRHDLDLHLVTIAPDACTSLDPSAVYLMLHLYKYCIYGLAINSAKSISTSSG